MQCIVERVADVFGKKWAVLKKFLGTELQFIRHETAVHSGENSSSVGMKR